MILFIASSDGNLLLLSDIEIQRILADAEELRGVGMFPPDDTDQEKCSIYSRKWLKIQRMELKKRLGLEFDVKDAKIALEYDTNIENMISKKDILTSTSRGHCDLPFGKSFESEIEVDRQTSESWLVRIVRFLVSQILNR